MCALLVCVWVSLSVFVCLYAHFVRARVRGWDQDLAQRILPVVFFYRVKRIMTDPVVLPERELVECIHTCMHLFYTAGYFNRYCIPQVRNFVYTKSGRLETGLSVRLLTMCLCVLINCRYFAPIENAVPNRSWVCKPLYSKNLCDDACIRESTN